MNHWIAILFSNRNVFKVRLSSINPIFSQFNHRKNVNSYPLTSFANRYQCGMMKANKCFLLTCEVNSFSNCCSFNTEGQVTYSKKGN